LPSERPARRFADIIDNIERIEHFTAGVDLAAFVAQETVVYAVQHALLIVSEAARRLGAHAERLAPGQPWADIRSIGNVLAPPIRRRGSGGHLVDRATGPRDVEGCGAAGPVGSVRRPRGG
jgi:hypothetical protein